MSCIVFDSSKAGAIIEQMASQVATSQLTQCQLVIARNTIARLSVINNNLLVIGELKSEELRNKKINVLTGGGAEPGFSPNMSVLIGWIELITHTYLKAKKMEVLPTFFACFSTSDPCLNGRMESLSKYAASLEGMVVDSTQDPEKNLIFPSTLFAEILMSEFEGGSTLEDFATYVQTNLSQIALKFREFEERESASIFLDYLENRGVYVKGTEINWESLIGKFVTTRNFNAIYNQALSYVI